LSKIKAEAKELVEMKQAMLLAATDWDHEWKW
jgi:hypothetical protein